MKDIVNTLYLLANVANSEATALSKMKDAKSQAKAKQLYAKQAQLANVATQLQKAVKAIDAFEDLGKPSLEPLMVKVLEGARKELAPIMALKYPQDKEKLVNAIHDTKINQQIVNLNNLIRVIKRNLELRELAVKHLMESDETDESILDDKRRAYAKHVAKDAALHKAKLDKPQDLVVELDKANHDFAKTLEEKYKIKDLPENAKPAPLKPNAARVLSTLVKGVAKLVKTLASDPDASVAKPIVKSFLGKLVSGAVSLLAGLFTNFFEGKTSSDKDKEVKDFGKNVAKIIIDKMDEKASTSKAYTPMKESLRKSAMAEAKASAEAAKVRAGAPKPPL